MRLRSRRAPKSVKANRRSNPLRPHDFSLFGWPFQRAATAT